MRARLPLLLLVSAVALSACHRVGSYAVVDVCRLANDAVADVTAAPGKPLEDVRAPLAGSCRYTVHDGVQGVPGALSISVDVYTDAARRGLGADLGHIGTLILAEASQTYAAKPSTTELAGLARYHAVLTYQNGATVLLSGDGALLVLEAQGVASDKVLALARTLWPRLVAYRPPAS